MTKIRTTIDNRLLRPLMGFLKQGITPKKLALTVALGITVGLFPMIGVTTVLCLMIAIPLRLNMAVIQLINYFAYPLQIVLIIPLIEAGSWMLNINPVPYSIVEMLELLNSNFSLAITKIWLATVLGMFAWLVFIVPFGLITYLILKTLFTRWYVNVD